MDLCTPLGIWGSVGLRACSWLLIGHVLIPTKTSQFWNQFSGSVPFHANRYFQVRSASLVCFLSCLIFCAVILSVVSLSFITLYHLFLIPGSSSRFDPCMTCSHHMLLLDWLLVFRFHIMWLATAQGHACPYDLAGQVTGLFPYGCRASWHMAVLIVRDGIERWPMSGIVFSLI